jgi:hypothetical protein
MLQRRDANADTKKHNNETPLRHAETKCNDEDASQSDCSTTPVPSCRDRLCSIIIVERLRSPSPQV